MHRDDDDEVLEYEVNQLPDVAAGRNEEIHRPEAISNLALEGVLRIVNIVLALQHLPNIWKRKNTVMTDSQEQERCEIVVELHAHQLTNLLLYRVTRAI